MGLRPDQTYRGTVTSGQFFQSQAKGTPGFQVHIETDGGEITHVIWLTGKNKERAEKDFETLGIDPEKLKSRSFIQHELSNAIVGAELDFRTKAEEYNGKTSIKTAWIGKPRAANEHDLIADVAAFFGAESNGGSSLDEDDDIPF